MKKSSKTGAIGMEMIANGSQVGMWAEFSLINRWAKTSTVDKGKEKKPCLATKHGGLSSTICTRRPALPFLGPGIRKAFEQSKRRQKKKKRRR